MSTVSAAFIWRSKSRWTMSNTCQSSSRQETPLLQFKCASASRQLSNRQTAGREQCHPIFSDVRRAIGGDRQTTVIGKING